MSEKFCGSEGRPTRRDVATLARVSGTTVSRVLGGRPDESVSAKARQRVLDAARQLGYIPNPAAKALRSGRSGLVGLWMCLEYSQYRGRVLGEIRRILKETDFALSVNDVDEDYAGRHSLDRVLRVPTEGIIAFEPFMVGDAFVEMDVNVPFVSMGAFWIESKSYVAIDLRAGAEEAMDHLISTGRKRIAYVVPKNSTFVTEGDRYEGYRTKMEAAGLPMQTILVPEEPEARLESLREQLSGSSAPDALLCFFDDIALDAVEILQQIGLTPGKDMAVVGFNGQEELERGPYPISTVRQPIQEMCRLAFESLSSQMNDPMAPLMKVVLKPELVVRKSSEKG